MPGENLTRIEAQERKSLVEVDSYDVVLDLTTSDTTFRSTTTVRFTASAGASTFIDAITAEVHSVTLNGAELGAGVADGVRIALENLAADNELVVVADFAYTNTGEGLHRFVDPVDGEVYLYSQFEVPDSRRVFAVFEQPDLKATFRFTITAPEAWQVVSNQPTPEPQALGTKADPTGTGAGDVEVARWVFEPTPRISSYITAIVAGPYEVVRSELTSSDGRTIPLGVFARKSLFGYLDADYIFDITRKGFAYFEEKFDYPYPFEKYDQLFVPEFNAGAMENAGAVTFTETYVFRSKVTDAIKERRVVTILHELAHMWFGDLVTMKWWNDLWLNESFAEWASTIATAEATEWTNAWTTFQAMEKSWAYRQDQLPSTHPVVADIRDLDDVQVNFDGITYAKGGSVLKQLEAWVGIDAFFAGVGAYFRAHEWGNTELGDLLRELEKTSGRDLSTFSAQWLETAGVNTLKPEIDTDADGTITAFRIRQAAHPDYPTLRQHRMAVGFYDFASDAADAPLVRVHRHEFDLAPNEVNDIAELVGLAKPALVLLNDDDFAYAKIRMDDDSFHVAVSALSRIEDPLARALVWGSAWDSTRDGEIAARDYVQLVLGNIGTETESTTIRLSLTQLVQTARLYVDPATREATIREVGDRLWQLAQDAASGSDAQFQFVKFFANIASTTEHAATLQALRGGEVALDGLEIDTDLDWELLEGLVLIGAAGELEIAAALDKDDTANGQQSAARARASIPTAEAKEAALTAALNDTSISNVVLRNMALGYTHTNDPASLGELLPLYFDSIRRVWD
ncbi:MAG TPA: aminopeptidase N, partial [Protaetiibacter sp.]|nr:aminopeptidase N [Protaetiibacter sp.]